MDNITLKQKLVEDIQLWIESGLNHNVRSYYAGAKQLIIMNSSNILDHTNISEECMQLSFCKGSTIIFIITPWYPLHRLSVRFMPTTNTNVDVRINDTIKVRYTGNQYTSLNNLNVHNVADLYSIMQNKLQFSGECIYWTVDHYFTNIPKLSSIQYMIEHIQRKDNPDITIEI